MALEEEEVEIARFYRVSRIPTMVGRLPDGSKIPGGPYTALQFAVLAAMLIGLVTTWGLWAKFGFLGNIAFFLLMLVVPVYLAGMAKTTARSPLILAQGLGRFASASRTGTIDGLPLKFPKPHTAATHALYEAQPAPTGLPDPVPPVAPGPAPEQPRRSASPERRPVTALERFQAQSKGPSR
ncbi:hypothetical protein SPF06_18970 [Sinomonas sp. JGH33]|uniref:PrgI family protein n=1 Tax=Sinomonas terricola TaxID=3110330 RepID=A0ABU5TAT9_9MICC|nr:hypothetical protein [Sinomonas sp. JGH33]MEA5456810.1 hypothetical protein [Sinomonas sp. JGH33]